jgi:hypothetical protein
MTTHTLKVLSVRSAQRVLRFIEKQEERPDGLQVSDIANAVGTDATSIVYNFLRFIRFTVDDTLF